MGESHKVEWIMNIKHMHNIDFVGLQETRVSYCNKIIIVLDVGAQIISCLRLLIQLKGSMVFCLYGILVFSPKSTYYPPCIMWPLLVIGKNIQELQ